MDTTTAATEIKRSSLTHWRGKTVYRSCRCGETAFDAVYAGPVGDEGSQYLYRCRNCNSIHLFNTGRGNGLSAIGVVS